MKEISTDIVIDAPKERIWELLTDFEGYANWNPFIYKMSGKLKKGSMVNFKVNAKGRNLFFVAKIRTYDENKALSWGGPEIDLVSKIVNADHYFEIEEISENQCRLLHGERFSGLLPKLAWRLIKTLQPSYEAMNEQLKIKAEAA